MEGVCANGTTVCESGALLCAPNVSSSPETCNGLDDDCNGLVDDGVPGGGQPCGCGGTTQCQNGVLSCLGEGGQTYFEETWQDLNAQGWTLGQNWQIGPAQPSKGHVYGNPDPADDVTRSEDNHVAGVVLGGNAPTDGPHPFRWLTSPVIDTSSAPAVHLRYWRWLNSDWAPYMQSGVQVFDGSSWVTLWVSGGYPGVTDSEWMKVTHDLTEYKNANMRVRFGYGIGAGVFSVSQWNIDDIRVTSAPCE